MQGMAEKERFVSAETNTLTEDNMKKTAIITGASSGIGRQFALSLAEHGTYDEVWVIARNTERLEQLKSEMPFPVKAIPMDLQGKEYAENFKKLLEEEKPDISLLMNCAGFGIFDSVESTSFENNLGMIDLNCSALTAMTLLSLPYMSEGSEIINIASVAAFQPIPYINIYAASKAYVLYFSRALNRELKSRGIRVFAVCPFWTKSRFFDRAIEKDKEPVVKKYVAMYTPDYIVKTTWKAMKNKRKDYVIPGFKARMQAFGVKLLPHTMVMSVWQKQQRLK